MGSAWVSMYAMVCILYVVSSYNQQKFTFLLPDGTSWWWWWKMNGREGSIFSIKTILHKHQKENEKAHALTMIYVFFRNSVSQYTQYTCCRRRGFFFTVSSLSDKTTTTTKLFRWIRFIYCTHTFRGYVCLVCGTLFRRLTKCSSKWMRNNTFLAISNFQPDSGKINKQTNKIENICENIQLL